MLRVGGCHFKFLRMDNWVHSSFIYIFPEFSQSFCCFQALFHCIQMKKVCFSLIIRRIFDIQSEFSKRKTKFILTNSCNAKWQLLETMTTAVFLTVSVFVYEQNISIISVFPDFSNVQFFSLIFQVIPECCKPWMTCSRGRVG